MVKTTIEWHNGKKSVIKGGEPQEGPNAFHIDVEGCEVLVPYAWYTGGEVERLNP